MSDPSDLYAEDHHWGSLAIDVRGHDLPALKARYLLNQLATEGRLLEIGCGGGRLLNTIAAYRPHLDLHGCDIRPLRHEPTTFEFRLVDPSSASLPYVERTFDTVVMFDVLEHVVDPASMLRLAAGVLRTGGELVSFTPLEGQRLSFYRMYRGLLGDDLYVETKEHLHAFDEATLRALVGAEFLMHDVEYAYHLLGHLMDATLFAALRFPAIRNRFWTENPFYAEDGPQDGAEGSLVGSALRAANALAYAESTALRHTSIGAAGMLFSATTR